ncbi:hypothetical protein B0H11DRAFT_2259134 [Mycena galericulata]|nr:hypothetical protein B0H11DRAFT_2259134 [Mycena galericulata]
MSTHVVHCEVPIHLDPGATGKNPKKYYLVTGVLPDSAGAYVSWQSADAQYKSQPGATLKSYVPADWALLVSAWHAACERGEHGHLHNNAVASTEAATLKTPGKASRRCWGIARAQFFPPPRASIGYATATYAGAAYPTYTAAHCRDRKSQPQSLGSLYIKFGGHARIRASDHFHRLQRAGEHPVLSVCTGLTAAVAFIEADTDLGNSDPCPDSDVSGSE